MPLYEYECPEHGRFLTEERDNTSLCPHTTPLESGKPDVTTLMFYCGLTSKRKWSVNVQPSMQEHFNTTIGKPVSNMNAFKDGLKRASEEATLRPIEAHADLVRAAEEQGIDIGDAKPRELEHNFVPVDMRDKEALGVTDEGLDATRKQQTDSGKRERKFYSS